MTNVIKLTPKQLSNDEFMRRYRAECAATGTSSSSDKAKYGDPGVVTTTDGDVMIVGQCSDAMFESLQFEAMELPEIDPEQC